jgi:DNA invertase Pin-like site-specific DNA recombinase
MRQDIPYEQRAAIYVRVSDKKQSGEDKYSEPTQIEECQKWAAKQNPPLIVDPELIVVEEPHTGEDLTERPGLMRLIDLAERGVYRTLICLSTDRLTRGGSDHLGMIRWRLGEAGAVVRFALGDVRDIPYAGGVLALQADGARQENAIRIERMMRTNRARAKRQYLPSSRAPFGYMFDVTDVDLASGRLRKRQLLPNPETAPIVRLIYDLLAHRGYGLKACAEYLNGDNPERRRYPTPAQYSGRKGAGTDWFAASVRQLIYEPKYWGEVAAFRTATAPRNVRDRRRDGSKFKNTKKKRVLVPPSDWILPDEGVVIVKEPLVDRETAKRALANTSGGRPRGNHLTRKNVDQTLLGGRGIVLCGYCLHAMIPHTGYVRKDGSKFFRYRCNARQRSKHICTRGSTISADALDRAVWERVLYLLDNFDFFTMMAEKDAKDDQGAANPASWLKTIDAQLENVERRLDTLMRRLEEETDPDEIADIKARRHQLQEERRGYREQRERAIHSQEEAEERASALRSISENAADWRKRVFEDGDFQDFLLKDILGTRVLVFGLDRTPRVQLQIRLSLSTALQMQKAGLKWGSQHDFGAIERTTPLTEVAAMGYYGVLDEFDPESANATQLAPSRLHSGATKAPPIISGLSVMTTP